MEYDVETGSAAMIRALQVSRLVQAFNSWWERYTDTHTPIRLHKPTSTFNYKESKLGMLDKYVHRAKKCTISTNRFTKRTLSCYLFMHLQHAHFNRRLKASSASKMAKTGIFLSYALIAYNFQRVGNRAHQKQTMASPLLVSIMAAS
jgi:hypothetical protein